MEKDILLIATDFLTFGITHPSNPGLFSPVLPSQGQAGLKL